MRKSNKTSKRLISGLLALTILLSVVVVGFFSVTAAVVEVTPRETPSDVYFVVPETIYLKPSLDANTSLQYYVDSTIGDYKDPVKQASLGQLEAKSDKTYGEMWFYCENATRVKVECLTTDYSPIIQGRVSKKYNYGGNPNNELGGLSDEEMTYEMLSENENGYMEIIGDSGSDWGDLQRGERFPGNFVYFRLGGTSTAKNENKLVTWKASYLVDGKWYEAYAYSYIYKPNYIPTFTASRFKRGDSGSDANFLHMINGLHNNVPGNRDLRIGQTTNQNDLVYPLLGGSYLYSSVGTTRDVANFMWNGAYNANVAPFGNGSGTGSGYYVDFKDGNGFNNTSKVMEGNGGKVGTNYPQIASFTGSGLLGGEQSYINNTTNLFIDSSRYNNLNQLPNLTAQSTATGYWSSESNSAGRQYNFIAWDADSNFLNNAGVDNSTNYSTNSQDCLGSYSSGNTNSYLGLGTDGTMNTARLLDWEYTGNNWDSTVRQNVEHKTKLGIDIGPGKQYTNPSIVFRYAIKTSHSTDVAHARYYIPLNIGYSNKQILRTKMNNIIKDYASQNSSLYSAGWTNYENAIKNLATVLCKPDRGYNQKAYTDAELNALVSAVDTAKASLTPVAVQTGTAVAKDFNIATNAQIGTDRTESYNYGDTVTGKASALTGYQYVNMEKPDGSQTTDDSSEVSRVNVGTLNWKFYYAPIYYIKYNANGGTGTIADSADVVYGITNDVKFSDGTGFTKDNYTLQGWATSAAGAVAYGLNDVIVPNTLRTTPGAVNIYAKWLGNLFDVTYKANGGVGDDVVQSDAGRYGEAFNLLTYDGENPIFTKNGYGLVGWTTTEGGTTVDYAHGAQISAANAGPMTLYAVWEALPYDVKYFANGGNGATVETTAIYDSVYTIIDKPADFTRANHEFKGWNTTADGNGQNYDPSDEVTVMGAMNFYAVWEGNEFTVNYDANGGEGSMQAETTRYGEEYTLAANAFTKQNYHFVGWKDANGTLYTDTLQDTGNITLYAQWEGDEFTVSYDANGGAGSMQAETTRYGEEYTLAANAFTKQNYYFVGWKDADGNPYAGTLQDTGNITLYAQWEGEAFDVVYNPNGGSGAVFTHSVGFYGSPYTVLLSTNLRLNYSKSKYTFVDWNTEADGSGKTYLAGETIPGSESGAMTLYAQWEENPVENNGGWFLNIWNWIKLILSELFWFIPIWGISDI